MPNTNINRRVVLSDDNRFTPPPISGYSLWFRADGLSNGTTNNYGVVDSTGNISRLSDLGGSTIYAEMLVGANQPNLVSGVVGNKLRKTVRFNGSPDRMPLNNANNVTRNVGGVTAFIVSKLNTSATNQFPLYFSEGTTAGDARFAIFKNTSDSWSLLGKRLDGVGSTSLSFSSSATASYRVVTSVIDYTNADAFDYINGSQVASNTSFQTAGSTSNTASLDSWLGSASSGFAFVNGDVSEWLVYPIALTASEVLIVSTWLNNFYRIY